MGDYDYECCQVAVDNRNLMGGDFRSEVDILRILHQSNNDFLLNTSIAVLIIINYRIVNN